MSLRDQRAVTAGHEHELAVRHAEMRLGRKLTAGEQRIDIVGQDRDLQNGKQALLEAVQDEQHRAVEEFARNGTPIHLRVTDAMLQALSDLYDAGVEHATREVEAARGN